MPNSYNSTYTGGQHDTYVLKQDLIDLIYPIGAVYISVNSTNPGTLFGGTWEQIKDQFLLYAGDTYAAGSTGGAASLSHNHNEGNLKAAIGASASSPNVLSYVPVSPHERGPASIGNYTVIGADYSTTTRTFNHYTQVYGYTSSVTQSILPPYLSVYVWKRTA